MIEYEIREFQVITKHLVSAFREYLGEKKKLYREMSLLLI